MSIVTAHAFMSINNSNTVVMTDMSDNVVKAVSENQMAGEMCDCQPGQCQTIVAQADISSEGLTTFTPDFSRLELLSYNRPTLTIQSHQALEHANASLVSTLPPLTVRFQSFLI